MATKRRTGRRTTGRSGGNRNAEVARSTEIVPALSRPLTAEDRRNIDRIADKVVNWISDLETGRREIAEDVLRDVFDNDAAAMVRPERTENPRLTHLLDRLEGDGVLKRRTLLVLLRVVGYDHLVKGRYWKRLQTGVKERLLPLVDPAKPAGRESLAVLNDAAQHAVAFDLDPLTAAEYVRERLRTEGRRPRRNAGFATFERQATKDEDLFTTDDGLARLLAVCDRRPQDEVAALEKKLERVGEAMLQAAKKLKGRGK